MADEKTVTVDLKRTYGKNGRYYGPGTGIEVPESLARSLRLTQPTPAKKTKAKAKK
ncbi:MAG TPA: hypothetical protein VEB59_06915 [Gemmatimonadales bacterium]|nr:hypothetical protein [Gemmatimonadales bacterium]